MLVFLAMPRLRHLAPLNWHLTMRKACSILERTDALRDSMLCSQASPLAPLTCEGFSGNDPLGARERGVARARGVLGRRRGLDERGVDDRAVAHHHAVGLERGVDAGQDFLHGAVLLDDSAELEQCGGVGYLVAEARGHTHDSEEGPGAQIESSTPSSERLNHSCRKYMCSIFSTPIGRHPSSRSSRRARWRPRDRPVHALEEGLALGCAPARGFLGVSESRRLSMLRPPFPYPDLGLLHYKKGVSAGRSRKSAADGTQLRGY